MKEIIVFFNDNAIVTSLLTLAITFIKDYLSKRSDRKYNKKQELLKERKEEFLNKAELHIEEEKWDSKEKPDICIFITDFDVSIDATKEVSFNYSKNILKKDEYKHLRFYMKNIGNADINQLDICATNQRNTMLCDIDSIKYIVDSKFVNYSYCYDRKILKNDIILIDIAFLEDSKIRNTFSSELALLFRDSYGNLYEQPFFIQQRNLYEPHRISNKEYRACTLTDTAIECFKNPWMW